MQQHEPAFTQKTNEPLRSKIVSTVIQMHL